MLGVCWFGAHISLVLGCGIRLAPGLGFAPATGGTLAIKDKITGWFIRNIIIPTAEDLRNPGYVVSKFSEGGQTISLREFFLPERFYADFESRISKELGDDGEQLLYSIGKKFGYRYAKLSYFKPCSQLGRKKFLDFMYLFARYIEVIYAKTLDHSIDLGQKKLEISTHSYVGCELNGLGYLLLIGAWTGGWAFLMEDKSVEGIQTSCEGRGDRVCRLICAPAARLKKSGLKPRIEIGIDEEESCENWDAYNLLNAVHPSTSVNYSLKEMIENRLFEYQSGKLFFNKQRMVGIEASMYYLIDNGFSDAKDKRTRQILFDSAYQSGYHIARTNLAHGTQHPDLVFVQRFLSGIGFGDVAVERTGKGKGYAVTFRHFPWTRFSENCKFTLLAGFTSGLLSGCSGKQILLSKVSTSSAGDGFHVRLA